MFCRMPLGHVCKPGILPDGGVRNIKLIVWGHYCLMKLVRANN